MENLFLNTNIINKLFTYFPCEIISIFAVFLNIILYMFFSKKNIAKKISFFITSGVFALNFILSCYFFIKTDFLSFGNDLIVENKESVLLKLLINLFFLMFIISIRKNLHKTKFKLPIVNSISILIAMFSSLLIQSGNFALTYILFEIISYLVYKFASSSQIRKITFFSFNYIVISFCATTLFVLFYFADYKVVDEMQKNILQSCMAITLLLKFGFFPIYNYLNDNKYKKNIPYSIMLCCFYPFIGALVFKKITFGFMYNEIFQLSCGLFVLITMILFAISSYKAKNISKYLACSMYIFIGIYILNTIFIHENILALRFILSVLFCQLGIYSLLCVLKNNLRFSKLNMSLFKGIFYKDKFFTLILLFLFLCMSSVIPSLVSILQYKLSLLLYSFDKAGFINLCTIIFCNILVIIKTIEIIENCCTVKNLSDIVSKNKFRQTSYNYVVCLIVIITLYIL